MKKHITKEQMIQIRLFLQCGITVAFIIINVNKTNIYFELITAQPTPSKFDD